MHIINKNEKPISIDLKHFSEVNLVGKKLKNIITGKDFIWGDIMNIAEKGSIILTTKR